MLILTTQPESFFKDKIEYFFISSLKIRDDFRNHNSGKIFKYEGILVNQEIHKTVKKKLTSAKRLSKYVIFCITVFDERIIKNIKTFCEEQGYDGPFLTTNRDLKKCTINITSLFDDTIF